MGIGLGEDAGLLVTDGNTLEAIGSGLTILVDGRFIDETNIYDVKIEAPVSIEGLNVHVMALGDKYDLQKHLLHLSKTIKIEEDIYPKLKD